MKCYKNNQHSPDLTKVGRMRLLKYWGFMKIVSSGKRFYPPCFLWLLPCESHGDTEFLPLQGPGVWNWFSQAVCCFLKEVTEA